MQRSYQETLIALIQESVSLSSGFDVSNLFPSIKVLPLITGTRNKMMKIRKKMDLILDSIISDHQEHRPGGHKKHENEDILDVLLRLKYDGGLESPISFDNIKAVLLVYLSSLFDFVSCRPFGSLKMSDVERVDMGSQAEDSSSSKRDMGSYISTMKFGCESPPHLTMSKVPADDSQQRVETSDPKIVATRIRKAQAAAKRKAEKNRGSEGASGPEGSSKRRKEKSTDHIPCPTPLRTIEAVTSDVSRGENVVSPTQAQGDNLLEIPTTDSAKYTTRPCEEHHDEHSGVKPRSTGSPKSIPTAATRPDNGKSIAQEETPMPDPLPKGAGADEAGSSLPPSLFVPTWGIHQRSRVTTPEECRDLMVNLIPPGVQEEMHLLDNNVVLDRAWFSLARGAMAQAHALRQFESLYDTHHALQESLETTRSHLVRTREDFNVVQNFYNTLSERHRKLREEHAQCSEGLAVVRAEKDSLMATNAEQALRIKELEQQLKSADEVHSSAVKDLESQLAQKDSALVYAERISGERHSENEELRAQLAFARKEKTDAIRKLLPTVVERLLQSHEYKQSLSVPFNYALQTGWGQGLAEERSEQELHKIMMRMNGFDPYSDKKMNAEYERLFSKTYSYVDRISHLSEKPVQDLLKLHPAPPPRDAPKAGSGGIVFAPRLVRAAEVARSKDTTSLQDPASKNASEGSKAPPSKKT
ncbi:gypsy type transposase [Tanacetum coccineum]